jgi:phosphate transport system substrate-binding protein
MRAVMYGRSALLLACVSCLVTCAPKRQTVAPSAPSASDRSRGGRPATRELRIAGATSAAELFRYWCPGLEAFDTSIRCDYSPVATEEGIRRFKAGSADIAVVDWPVPEDGSSFEIPVAADAIVAGYRVDQATSTLVFSRDVLADMFNGAIGQWGARQLLELNGGAGLAKIARVPVTFVYRSDGSGTTVVWRKFLKLDPVPCSADAPYVADWPGGVSAEKSSGVAQAVANTNDSIGYLEYSYVYLNSLQYALVRNVAGQWPLVSADSLRSAMPSVPPDRPVDLACAVLNSPNRNAYPVTSLTWLVIPIQPREGAPVAEFLRYMLGTDGQSPVEAAGHVPLTEPLLNQALGKVLAHFPIGVEYDGQPHRARPQS